MVDRSYMTPLQRTIVYSAILAGILAVFSAFGSSINIAYHIYTSPGNLCPLDGQWGGWGSWSTCGSNCLKSKHRSCTNPAPWNGGKFCSGSDQENTSCTGGLCPSDGNWGLWSSWSSCGSNCKKSRSRSCNNPAPANGGNTCPGYGQESTSCTGDLCTPTPVHGSWGNWGSWSYCEVEICMKDRTRSCNNPAPSNGGKTCPGSNQERTLCSQEECEI